MNSPKCATKHNTKTTAPTVASPCEGTYPKIETGASPGLCFSRSSSRHQPCARITPAHSPWILIDRARIIGILTRHPARLMSVSSAIRCVGRGEALAGPRTLVTDLSKELAAGTRASTRVQLVSDVYEYEHE